MIKKYKPPVDIVIDLNNARDVFEYIDYKLEGVDEVWTDIAEIILDIVEYKSETFAKNIAKKRSTNMSIKQKWVVAFEFMKIKNSVEDFSKLVKSVNNY